MSFTTKESFKKAKVKVVPTPDGDAYVRVLSGKARDEWMQIYRAEQGKAGESPCEAIYCPLLVRTLCDEQGTRIWADTDTSELAENTDSKLLNLLFEAALDWNRLTPEAVEEEKKS